jgi:hypothetical protein
VATDAIAISIVDTGEVAIAATVQVAVKEPNWISMGFGWMAAMLVGKTTPDRATMLHSEFPVYPTCRINCQGLRPRQIRKGATHAVVG